MSQVISFFKGFRERRGWSARHFAKMTDFHHTTILRWEKGTQVMSPENRRKMWKEFSKIKQQEMDNATVRTSSNCHRVSGRKRC